MNPLVRYFHDRFYSDLPEGEVAAALADEGVKKGGVKYLQQKHYPDKMFEEIAGDPKIDPKPVAPFKMPERQYKKKPLEKWTTADYKEYDFDKEYGFAEKIKEADDVLRTKKNDPFFTYMGGSERERQNRIHEMYMKQADQDGNPFPKGHILYDKKPSVDKVQSKIEVIESERPWFNRDAEISKLGTTEIDLKKYFIEQLPQQEYVKYLDSPQYQKIAESFYGEKFKDAIEAQKQRVLSVPIRSGLDSSMEGEYSPKEHKIDVRLRRRLPDEHDKSVITHELSHASDRSMRDIRFNSNAGDTEEYPEDLSILEGKWAPFLEENLIKPPTIESTEDQYFRFYLQDPTEVRARVNTIRKKLFEKNIDLNSPDLDKLIIDSMDKDDYQYNQLQKVLPKDAIFKAIRELASSNNNLNTDTV